MATTFSCLASRLATLALASAASLVMAAPLAGCSSAVEAEDEDTTEDALTNFQCSAEVNKNAADAPHGQAVKGVRAAGHKGYDRFVIEFGGRAVPNYFINRQQGATFYQDGSGDPIDLPGRAGIGIYVQGASGWDMEAGRPTFTGPNRFAVGGARIMTEAASTGDFEGTFGWGIGLKRAACFRVFELANPARLVVDVQNDGPEPTDSVEAGTAFHCNGATIASGSAFGMSNKPADYGQVVAVRAASHPKYDRWVMEFTAATGVPSFKVERKASPNFTGTGEGPGSQFDLEGRAGLEVMLTPASGWDMSSGTPTFSGSRRFKVQGGTAIREVAQVEDFEGYVNWGMGLGSNQACYRAFKLTNPPRLVVDVQK